MVSEWVADSMNMSAFFSDMMVLGDARLVAVSQHNQQTLLWAASCGSRRKSINYWTLINVSFFVCSHSLSLLFSVFYGYKKEIRTSTTQNLLDVQNKLWWSCKWMYSLVRYNQDIIILEDYKWYKLNSPELVGLYFVYMCLFFTWLCSWYRGAWTCQFLIMTHSDLL